MRTTPLRSTFVLGVAGTLLTAAPAALLATLASGSAWALQARQDDTLPKLRADSLPRWISSIQILGTLDTELSWTRHPPSPLAGSRGADVYLRRVELAFSGSPVPWITAFTLFSSEFVGQGGTVGAAGLSLEEAHVTLAGPGHGPYGVLGLRTQPFGLFENRLMKDPLTSDLYSTDAVGITAGVTGPQGLDASVTVYRGDERFAAFLASPELDGGSLTRGSDAPSDPSSVILAATVAPEAWPLVVEASFQSEAGRGARNNTANVALHVSRLASEHVSGSIERFMATSRETLEHAPRPFLDGGLSVDLTYQGVVRRRRALGSGNFAQRRSRIADHPVDATVRYERFDDDGLSAAMSVVSVRDRASAGTHVTVFEGQGSVYVLGQLRWTRLRGPGAGAGSARRSNQELFLGLGVSF